ncbi:MAG: hypothetical protein IT323_16530, partial [Anaerolineae bacterium]|nr:hypothetical protein [Anaerolineae bacterium]
DDAEAFVGAQPVTADAAPVFAAELLPANGNRGEALLRRSTLPTVIQYLDRLQALGVGGVTLDIKLPILLEDYPRAADYLDFYRAVVTDVRRRGMSLLIESGPAFSGTIFSSIPYSFADLTTAEYFEKREAMLVTIAAELAPDYLAIGTETSTEEMLIGQRFSDADFAAFVHRAALSIRAANPAVRIGSGFGVWENPAQVQALLNDPALDYIGLHIYPLRTANRDLIEVTVRLADQIKSASKQVVIGEAWLYKAMPDELTGPSVGNFTEVYARDVYSFWSPLDVRFITLVKQMAEMQGYAYVSFFWSTYFFGYVDYADFPEGTSPATLFLVENRAAYANIARGAFSPTGQALRDMLGGS